MAIYDKLRGTLETLFRIGKGGPQFKNNAGVIEGRNAADGDFAIMRADYPLADDDVATKKYVDDTSSVPSGIMQTVRYTLDNSATQDSVFQIPAGAYVFRAWLEITTPYDVGTTISIGQAGNLTLLQATSDNDPESADIYIVAQDTAWGGTPLEVRTTVGGSPAAGAGVVIVEFSIPNV